MSANRKGGGNYEPAPEPRLTTAEFQEIGIFFKELLENTKLGKWIILAGLGAALEGLHILWLAVRYIFQF
jgi:hypothetical protein